MILIKNKKIIGITQITLVVMMSFAISFILSENLASAVISGADDASIGGGIPPSTTPVPVDSSYVGDVANGYHGTTPIADTSGAGGAVTGVAGAGGTAAVSGAGKGTAAAGGSNPLTFIQHLYTGKIGDGTLKSLPGGAGIGPLVAGAAWGATLFVAVKFIAPMLGASEQTTNALSFAVLGGSVAGGLAASLIPAKSLLGLSSTGAGALIGIGVAAAIFVLTYKKESKKMVTFQCLPYEPPLGGSQCETCNKDPFRPCSEYRCKSLGQACELLNKGTDKEQCAWVSKFDVTSPTIQPWTGALKPTGLKYVPDTTIRPPALGFKIVGSTSSGCLPAFTPLQFGIITNEPAQCKIDLSPGNFSDKGRNLYDSMQYYVGESNYYSYNHSQVLKLPGPANATGESPQLANDGTYSLYIRCQDANGNINDDVFAIKYCVDQGPDTTPPVIDGTSIVSGSPIQFNADKVPIEVYTNEPAECKWSRQSKAYEDMENPLTCGVESFQVNSELEYTCAGNLTGVKNNEDNTFFFRCKDQPDKAENDRNVNAQSYQLTLKGSKPLSILTVSPNETIYGSTDTTTVTLNVETDDGAQEGVAACYFSPTGASNSYVTMFNTNSFKHSQELDLVAGNYNYFFKCIDAAGNTAATNTSFKVFVDKQPPRITRAYKEEGLKIVTDEDAQCVYSLSTCNYNFKDGLKMIYTNPDQMRNNFAEWKSNAIYYIKCKDAYDNEPSPNLCSIIVSAVELDRQK